MVKRESKNSEMVWSNLLESQTRTESRENCQNSGSRQVVVLGETLESSVSWSSHLKQDSSHSISLPGSRCQRGGHAEKNVRHDSKINGDIGWEWWNSKQVFSHKILCNIYYFTSEYQVSRSALSLSTCYWIIFIPIEQKIRALLGE